ncbi:ATP-grasp domain-containing protein [Streptantibioticus rubrisoli]|uniref:ATP-grasp domain-containing protein n=1 Tax=Streptantibioticus rubrisoli TaxID=1387313 RepID=A0ABT1P577_9ACTN|nr:ATP-grasp domain-containing protein [Streptantibioticus rubrisoli]MCQ4040519.1 ATP-grasp domain-containing protein [Streptantibioticus rubrisoli]
MKQDRPAVLLVDPVRNGAGYKAAARELGFAVVSVYTLGFSTDTPGHDKGDDISLHLSDPAEVVRALTELGVDIKAVVPAMEAGAHRAAEIAHLLALPCNDPLLAFARRNKAAMRARAQETGLPIPRFRLVHTLDESATASREIGFPVIVKPTMGAGAQGVTLLSDPAALDRLAQLETHDVYQQPIAERLVEQYVRGREFSVNFFSSHGEHRIIDMWEYRQPDDRDYDFPIWDNVQIDESHPDWERVEAYVRQVLDAFGIEHGPSHTEVKATADGVYLMEIGPRLPGGPAVRMWAQHSKVRAYRDAIICYLGERPAIMDEPLDFRVRYGAMAIHNEEAPGTLVAIHGIEDLEGRPGIDDILVGFRPGDHVPVTRHQDDIPFGVVVSGATEADVLRTMGLIRSLVTLEIAPDHPAQTRAIPAGANETP